MGEIRHVKSNTIADATNTDLVRPSDWNSVHNYTIQDAVSLAGNTAGVLVNISSGTLYLAGGNNVTLSQDVNSVTISGPHTSQFLTTAMASNRGSDFVQATAAFAGTSASGTINSTGISVSIGPYITTAMASNRGSDFVQAAAAFAGTSASGTIASGGISVSVGPYITTAMLSNAVTISNIKVSAGTLSGNRSDITFNNSNGISFGLETNGIVTATVQTNYLTTAALSNHSHGNPTLALTNLSGTTASASNGLTLSLSAAAAGAAVINFSAGTTSSNIGSVVFSNSNGVSFGLNASTITASVAAGGGGAPTVSMWPMVEDFGWVNSSIIHTGASASTGGSTQFTGSIRLFSVPWPYQLEFNRLNMLVSEQATSAGTGSATVGLMMGFYTPNANTVLSLYTSYHWGLRMSQSSISARSMTQWFGTDSAANTTGLNGNVSASFTGLRAVPLRASNDTLSAPAGGYYVGMMLTQRTSNANVFGLISYGYFSASQSSYASFMGSNTYDGGGWQGIVSTSTNTNVIVGGMYMPGSIHTSRITGTGGTSQLMEPYFFAFKKTT